MCPRQDILSPPQFRICKMEARKALQGCCMGSWSSGRALKGQGFRYGKCPPPLPVVTLMNSFSGGHGETLQVGRSRQPLRSLTEFRGHRGAQPRRVFLVALVMGRRPSRRQVTPPPSTLEVRHFQSPA